MYPRGIERKYLNLFMFYYFSFSGVNGKSDGDVVYYVLNSLLSFHGLTLTFSFLERTSVLIIGLDITKTYSIII